MTYINYKSMIDKNFTEIYALIDRAVRYFSSRLFSGFFSEDDILDLIQEASSDIFEKLDRYDETKASMATWVSTLVRHEVIDTFSKERRRRGHFTNVPLGEYNEDGEVVGLNPATSEETDDYIIAADTERIMRASLSGDRETLIFEGLLAGLKSADIADLLGEDVGKVYSTTFRLRGRLRSHLDDAA